ncbi:MAG: hypothetical protein H7835_08990 [Magnetococcus sp. XQGC-1]
MRVPLEEAAQLAGVSRLTLHKKLEAGLLSVSTSRRSGREVETADLVKVFGPLKPIHPSARFQCRCPLCHHARQTQHTTATENTENRQAG